MPPIGRRPMTERYSFARRPLAHGGVTPAARLVVGELNRRELAGGLQIGRTVGNEARVGIRRAHGRVPAASTARSAAPCATRRTRAAPDRARSVVRGRSMPVASLKFFWQWTQ